jgi:hypothetical protein
MDARLDRSVYKVSLFRLSPRGEFLPRGDFSSESKTRPEPSLPKRGNFHNPDRGTINECS